MIRNILEIIHRKRAAYIQTFLDATGKPHQNAEIVLKDLRRVAGIDKGGIVISPVTRTVDPLATAYRAGQRDVYLRVVKFLALDGAAAEEQSDE
jgi:hypothetical protein